MNEALVYVEGTPSLESSVTKEYTPVPARPSYGVFDGGDTSNPIRCVLHLDSCM